MLFRLLERLRNRIKSTESQFLPCDKQLHQRLTFSRPRTEILILSVGLACTILGKLIVIVRQSPPRLFTELAGVILPDILFFAGIFLVISCLYAVKPTIFVVRVVMVISILVSTWSILDLGWLIKSGTQFQPSILAMAIRDFPQVWPLVLAHLIMNWKMSFPLITIVLGICTYFSWRFYRPSKIVYASNHHARRAAWIAVAMTVLLLVQPVVRSESNLGFVSEVLGFSSHWYALTSTVSSLYDGSSLAVRTRNIPRAGERLVVVPNCPASQLPNVVLILLESVPYSETSLSNPSLGTTPYLASLASHGVEFSQTRVPVSRTTKAFWSVLTSTSPVIESDYVEAVPTDQPYEGLASILDRAGYRSAFFEMSKGTFECPPGLFSNLAFDWAWFRENLQDPSANLGYMSGDDCRMLKPAFEWALNGSKPFLLTMITTVSHDSYEVPQWFEKPMEKPYERYIQSLRYTDYFLEKLCERLKDNGLAENTILCILGDHGTSFRTTIGKGRWIPYEEVIRIPWVINWPGHLKEGQVIDWPCSQLDVTPTILKLVGFDISQAGFDGKDAFSTSEPNRRLFFSSWYSDSPIGFIEAGRKFVYWPCLNKVFEYDLIKDTKEENPDIVPLEKAEQIKQDIQEWRKKSQIIIDAKRHDNRILFTHWHTFSTGRVAWTYYVP